MMRTRYRRLHFGQCCRGARAITPTVRTDNRLSVCSWGLQHMFDVGDVMRIGGSIKGGLYNNFVDRNRTFVSENRVDNRSFEATDHDNVFAQGVEFNPRVELKLAEGTYLTASGQFLWLNNVSTALPHYATRSRISARTTTFAPTTMSTSTAARSA